VTGPRPFPCDEGMILGRPVAEGCPERSKPWVLAATILGSSMAFIDGSVVNIALPAIQRELDASLADLQWIVNGYTLLLGALILTGGALGDRFGRRLIFIIGIAAFTLASVACGLAPDSLTLIFARMLQGIGGALLVPSSLALISATFSEEERGRAIGTWAGFAALTTALGPVLGGWLVDSVTWRTVFFVNVPVAAVALVIALRHVPESRDRRAHAQGLDWSGAALATAGLGMLTYGLIALSGAEIGAGTGPPALAGAAVLLAFFVWLEARRQEPMVPLGLFRSRTFSAANLLTVLLYFALGGVLFFLPLNLVHVQGYSATEAGAALLPFTLVMGTLSRWSGGLVQRWGLRLPLVVGPATSGLGYALLAVPGIGGSYWTTFFPAMIVLGFGMAVAVAPLTTAVMAAVDEDSAGVASGINNAAARVAGLLAVACLGALAVWIYSLSLEHRLDSVAATDAAKQEVMASRWEFSAAAVPEGLTPAGTIALGGAIDEAFLLSFRMVTLIAALMAAIGALTAFIMIDEPPGGPLPARES
jgi:EmrB/QacA subfamily drug resistance transporter